MPDTHQTELVKLSDSLISEAKELGVDNSQAADTGIAEAIKKRKEDDWLAYSTHWSLCYNQTSGEFLMTRDEAIARLRKSELDLKRAGISHLYLFGSTARDEARPDSDIDLFFDFECDVFDLMDVREPASGILNARVDLIPRDGIHHVLRQRIEASALRVF
jgi:predicted nucleotidyltransferase